jgi:hypothetical protein
MRANTKGITLIGFIIVLCVLGFFAYAAMRLIPAYTEYFGVLKALDQESKEPGVARKSLDEIRRDLQFKFNTQYVDEANVPMQNVTMQRQGGNAVLRVAYERRISFIYNVDLLVTFDKSVKLNNAE